MLMKTSTSFRSPLTSFTKKDTNRFFTDHPESSEAFALCVSYMFCPTLDSTTGRKFIG